MRKWVYGLMFVITASIFGCAGSSAVSPPAPRSNFSRHQTKIITNDRQAFTVILENGMVRRIDWRTYNGLYRLRNGRTIVLSSPNLYPRIYTIYW